MSDGASPGETVPGSTSSWDSRTEAVLEEWLARVSAAQAAHYTLASRTRKRNVLIGVPTVLFSSVVGTSLFATLTRENVNKTLRIVIGLVSFAAAALAALQTFFASTSGPSDTSWLPTGTRRCAATSRS
ncbi:MAG: SLATT domain-containing protein [Actinomycetota bacterium]|nr:SLATT domain-containing protein [Actinomycetota bacterium]